MDKISYTPDELSKLLRVSKLTIYDLIKKGELPAYRVGRQMRVDEDDLERYKTKSRSGGTTNLGDQQPLTTILISGQDMALDMLAREMERECPQYRYNRSYEGSMNGLSDLYHGRCQIASIHLFDGATNTYNVPYIRHLLPGQNVVVYNLILRMEGFYVLKDNPRGISSWKDLTRSDLVMVNREKGSGVRVLIDEKLRQLGVTNRDVRGYDNEMNSHIAVAEAVQSGKGDVGVGTEMAAKLLGLDFIPLQKEQYDLVFLKADIEANPGLQKLIDILKTNDFKQKLMAIGHDVSMTGEKVGEI